LTNTVTDPLLAPLSTRNLTFRNRMVHAPTTMNMSDDKGYVMQKAVGAYEALEAGGFWRGMRLCDQCALGWACQRAHARLL
jgi:2,4-dienoyl-CoA reductase-like NADH-dependent reductase (Old Yellow Enzyme family)